MTITFPEPTNPQPIDLMPHDVAAFAFEFMDDYSLFLLSQVSKKWYAWVITYAPKRVRTSYPEYYTANMTGQVAFRCLVSCSIATHNLPNGRFRHIVIPETLFLDAQVNLPHMGARRHRFVVASHRPPDREELYVISSRNGVVKRFFEDRVLPSQDLVWRQLDRLYAWDLATGRLRHSIAIPSGVVTSIGSQRGYWRPAVIKNGEEGLCLLDLNRKRVLRLEPPGANFSPVRGANQTDSVFRNAHTVSVLWAGNQERLLALYSLDSDLEAVRPTSVTPFKLKVSGLFQSRRECGDLQLLEMQQMSRKTISNRWFILNAQGDSLFDKPVLDLLCTDELIILVVVDDDQHYTFQAYDPKERKVVWTVPMDIAVEQIAFSFSLMHAPSPERVFLYVAGVFTLLDLETRSIIKTYKIEGLGPSDCRLFHFDGDKIVQSSYENSMHILDFTYLTEAPPQVMPLSFGKTVEVGELPKPGQSYIFVPIARPARYAALRSSYLRILAVAGLAMAIFLSYNFLRNKEDLSDNFSKLRL